MVISSEALDVVLSPCLALPRLAAPETSHDALPSHPLHPQAFHYNLSTSFPSIQPSRPSHHRASPFHPVGPGLTPASPALEVVGLAAATLSLLQQLPFGHTPAMADTTNTAGSVYSYYSDTDGEHEDDSDIEEPQFLQANAVHMIRPGHASIVDLMRAERPTFKRASQIMYRRPIDRPQLSPVLPPRSYKRAFMPPARRDGDSASEGEGSDSSGRPSTPDLNDDGASTHSEASPTTPDTPKTSFGDDLERPRTMGSSIAPHSTADMDASSKVPIPRARKPSRFRMLTQRSLSMVGAPTDEAMEPMPQIPTMYNHGPHATRSVGNLSIPRRPVPVQMPSSPEILAMPPVPLSPAPSKGRRTHTRKNSLFTGRSRLLGLGRRTEVAA